MAALFVVFFMVPPVFVLIGAGTGLLCLSGAFDVSALLLLYISLACAYVMTFPALQAKSPTLAMVLALARAGSKGLAKEELKRSLGRPEVRDFLLEDLVRSGLVSRSKGGYTVTPKGRALAMFFLFFRRVLGLPQGRG